MCARDWSATAIEERTHIMLRLLGLGQLAYPGLIHATVDAVALECAGYSSRWPQPARNVSKLATMSRGGVFIEVFSPTGRTDLRARPVASGLETDVACPRSVQ